MCVPCCRTSIVPALTVCPANILTPSRWLWLSRPLRLVPPPLLFALVRRLLSRDCFLGLLAPRPLHRRFGRLGPGRKNCIDGQAGESLAVPVLPAITNFS